MMIGIDPPAGFAPASSALPDMIAKMQELEKPGDEAKVKETMRHSFMHAKHAIARTPDSELEGVMIKLFGRDATKRAALNLLVNHMHEHLGQSIAYARVNGVVPPWSAGGGF
jgi:uncharacterized damage-inducible protein DinB